jgi:death-on-curing protein
MAVVWLERDVLLALHDATLAAHGGTPGIADYMGLEMLRARPMDLAGRSAPSVPDLAAAQLCGFLLKRPFRSGNRRTAAAALEAFLALNQHELAVPEEDLAHAVQAVADGAWPPTVFAEWLNQSVRATA